MSSVSIRWDKHFNVTLPDPHHVTPGALLTINNVTYECVKEGEHCFWEKH